MTKTGPFDFLLHFSVFLLEILNIASQLHSRSKKTMKTKTKKDYFSVLRIFFVFSPFFPFSFRSRIFQKTDSAPNNK